MSDKIYRPFVLFLLVLIAATMIFSTYQSYQAQQQRAVIAEQIQSIADDTIATAAQYQDTAYDNPDVTRIAEQQLIATETEITELMHVTQQLGLLSEMMK